MHHTFLCAIGFVVYYVAALNSASAATITGVIRDFCAPSIPGVCSRNPDFEGVVGGLQQGQIGSTLGGDGDPVFVGSAKPGFTNAANFDQWYDDIPGANTSSPFSINLTETGPGTGVFEFSDSTFFPIDGLLFGNQGRGHNYHFTLELRSQVSFKLGDIFSYTGDDDLWVFIDDKLFMDLGGVHSPVSGSFSAADLVAAGLSPGVNYSLDIFFAERHTVQSNFRMTTSLQIAVPPIPIPAALPLFGTALAGLGLIGWRKRRAIWSSDGK